MSPSLQTVEFIDMSEENAQLIEKFLKSLAFDRTPLKGISLTRSVLTEETLEYLGTSIPTLQSLQLTGVGEYIDFRFLEEIGALEHLITLHIDFLGSPVTALDGPNIGFDSLTSLTVEASFFVLVELPDIMDNHLHSLFITIASRDNKSSQRKKFFKNVAARWSHSLKRFSITYLKALQDTYAPTRVPVYEELSPLFTLDLTYFAIKGVPMDISEDEVMQIASRWPRIETLLLPYARNPVLTSASLRTISERFTHLKTLSLPITPRKEIPSYPYSHTSDHGLQTLLIDYQDIQILELARYIDHLFPRLHSVQMPDNGEGNPNGSTAYVHHVVKKLQSIRLDTIAEFWRARVAKKVSD